LTLGGAVHKYVALYFLRKLRFLVRVKLTHIPIFLEVYLSSVHIALLWLSCVRKWWCNY